MQFFKKKKKKEEADLLFISSAKYISERVDPLDCLTGYEPEKAIKDDILYKLSNKFRMFIGKYREFKYKRKIKNLTPEAKRNMSISLYGDYYKNLYISKSADHILLKKLLIDFGSPDFNNPYGPTEVDYNLYHKCGFIATEINAILNYSLNKTEISEHYKRKKESDVYIIVDRQNELEKIRDYFEQAIISLAYIIFYGNNFNVLFKNVLTENIEFAIIEMMVSIDYEKLDFSEDDLIEKLTNKGFVKENVLRTLLQYKKIGNI